MAWSVKNTTLSMAEGEWGVALPITVDEVTLTEHDLLKFTFKDQNNGNVILTKEYTPVENTVNLSFTEAESALFPVGQHVYSLDWYQSGAFLCNIIPTATLKVVDKA